MQITFDVMADLLQKMVFANLYTVMLNVAILCFKILNIILILILKDLLQSAYCLMFNFDYSVFVYIKKYTKSTLLTVLIFTEGI